MHTSEMTPLVVAWIQSHGLKIHNLAELGDGLLAAHDTMNEVDVYWSPEDWALKNPEHWDGITEKPGLVKLGLQVFECANASPMPRTFSAMRLLVEAYMTPLRNNKLHDCVKPIALPPYAL